MITVENLYFGRLKGRIDMAQAWYREHGDFLRNDPTVSSALAALRTQLDTLDEAMRFAGFPSICGACARDVPGGCCDVSIAEDAYGMLLLINLLLEVELKKQHEDATCCMFIGPTGCTLRAKPLICWNYNCHDIHERLPLAGVERVERHVALTLQQLLVTEGAIRAVLEPRFR